MADEAKTTSWREWLCGLGIHILPRRWSYVWTTGRPENKTRYRTCACGRRTLYGRAP